MVPKVARSFNHHLAGQPAAAGFIPKPAQDSSTGNLVIAFMAAMKQWCGWCQGRQCQVAITRWYQGIQSGVADQKPLDTAGDVELES